MPYLEAASQLLLQSLVQPTCLHSSLHHVHQGDPEALPGVHLWPPGAFSSSSYLSTAGTRITSWAFSQVGSSSFHGGLGTMNVVGGYTRVGGTGDTASVSVNQSLLSPLKLEVDPNIQAVCTLEKEQFKTRNSKFASFIGKARNVEQQNEILETKWSLLQQRKTARSNVDNMFEGYINNFAWQLNVIAQEKLSRRWSSSTGRGWWRTLRISKRKNQRACGEGERIRPGQEGCR